MTGSCISEPHDLKQMQWVLDCRQIRVSHLDADWLAPARIGIYPHTFRSDCLFALTSPEHRQPDVVWSSAYSAAKRSMPAIRR